MKLTDKEMQELASEYVLTIDEIREACQQEDEVLEFMRDGETSLAVAIASVALNSHAMGVSAVVVNGDPIWKRLGRPDPRSEWKTP